MTCTLVGDVTIGALNPIVLSSLGSAGTQLAGNVTAALALQAQASIGAPPLTEQLAAMQAAVSSLEQGIALGLPGVTFSVSDASALVVAARAALGTLGTLVGLMSASVYCYEYSGGIVTNLGSDISSGVTGSPPPGLSGGTIVAGVLVGAQATAWAGISPYFGGLG